VIVDVNVLLAYVDADHARHRAASAWLDAALNGVERVGLPWHSLLGFLRITTHPKIGLLSLHDALTQVAAWLAAPSAWIPNPGPAHARVVDALLRRAGVGGLLVPDAHLAALAVENRVAVCSFDADFDRFGVKRHSP